MKIASYTITHNGLTEGTLEATIQNLQEFSDYITVVVSASSDDGTREFVKEKHEEGVIDSFSLEHYDFPEEESKIRKLGFDAAKSFDPDWIAAIDDDEIVGKPEMARKQLHTASNNDIQTCDLAAAYLYHMWKGKKYRNDGSWKHGEVSRIIFYNNNTDFKGVWAHETKGDKDIHSGRLPLNNQNTKAQVTGHINLIHFGWYINHEKRVEKMESKKEHDNIEEDADSYYAETQRKHYDSIYEEPELKELPEKYVEGREDLFHG